MPCESSSSKAFIEPYNTPGPFVELDYVLWPEEYLAFVTNQTILLLVAMFLASGFKNQE